MFQGKSFTITFCKPCKLFVKFCELLIVVLRRKCPMALKPVLSRQQRQKQVGLKTYHMMIVLQRISDAEKN